MLNLFKIKNIIKLILNNYYYPNIARLIRYISPLKKKYYEPFNDIKFKKYLNNIGIKKGDSIFIMCSVNNIYKKTGHNLPVNIMLNAILEVVGKKGTVMALSFSHNREKILSGKEIFNIRKTNTTSGILSELIRRKSGSVRSMHPIFSAVAYGYKAKVYCSEHHKSFYPFDRRSPYYKIMQDSGKYLGIGCGIEAYTPAHMIDDYFKDFKDYPVRYENFLRKCFVINSNNKKNVHKYYYRSNKVKGVFAPKLFFSLLKINYTEVTLKSGILIFSMNMMDYYNAGINLYNDKKINYYITGLPKYIEKFFNLYQSIRNVLASK
jgi:aminoglycoside N3'-acetyltransferase